MTYNHNAVRIAQYHLRAHINQVIHKEQAALKHLLMYENAALGLCCCNQQYAQKVRGKSRPRSISQCHY